MFYTLENDKLSITVSDLGATLVKFIDKKTGLDLVLGYESEEDYILYNGANIGASVGRNANRIGNAKFTLNGKEYLLSKNDHDNQLHGGGRNGFAFKKWQLEKQANDSITFSYFSKDLEEGFPGNLTVNVSYKLVGNKLIWSYEGSSDQDTILNMTNHSYFNLGEGSALDLKVQIHTDTYSPVDENSLTLENTKSVFNTNYDFTKPTLLKENALKFKNGIDNNYVWENLDDKLMVTCTNDKVTMNIYSDLPDMHLYTAAYLGGEKGKYNRVYKGYDGVCFEAQYYPNAINYSKYIKPILRKDQIQKHYICYEII